MTNIDALLKRSPLYPALVLESHFSGRKRRLIMKVTEYILLSIPVIIILGLIFGSYNLSNPVGIIDVSVRKLFGLTLISLGLYGAMQAFQAYFCSVFYFEYVAKNTYKPEDLYTFSAGRILRRAEKDNLLTGLLRSQSLGRRILRRLGLTSKETESLLAKQAEIDNPPLFRPTSFIKLADILSFIYEQHADFRELLANHGLTKSDLLATAEWVVYDIENREYDRQWWLKEKLLQIPGVAADWSFGRTYLLNRFSRQVLNDKEVNSQAITFSRRTRELEQIQSVLARSSGGNAILVGLPGQEKMEVIWNLGRQIKRRTVQPELLGKELVLFSVNDFSSAVKDKDDFEDKLSVIFGEALNAGNIVLVIDNLPRLILQAKQYGLSLTEIIEPYLSSHSDQIIALTDTEYYHSLIEPDRSLMARFETVMVKPLLLDEITQIIARGALTAEKAYEIVYTYPAILEIARSAEYYFPDGVSSDKAEDLLAEISPWAVEKGLEMITKDDVLSYIESKTGIPTAALSDQEKGQLLDLENVLMKRVVAQREAVFAVANAIRRNRAGIRDLNRPIGSFLFLGPTGVGKTETAKALAEALFGSENLLLRFDMSEYQNDDALTRLIGSETDEQPGQLADVIREHPYGVLLLDEFEKTNKKVLNLFLQIIDEGYFTDGFGKKVSARNILFIATSNAGAEKIFSAVSAGQNPADQKEEIIADIIKNGDFKPELVNRFDATIIFHPLSPTDLEVIAELRLKKIAKRLGEKGIVFKSDKKLISFIAQNGYNPTFGARPMNRLIQDTVEQHLADLIIRDRLQAGRSISFEVIGQSGNKDSLKPVIE